MFSRQLCAISLCACLLGCAGSGSNATKDTTLPPAGNYVGSYELYINGKLSGEGTVPAGNVAPDGTVYLGISPTSGSVKTNGFVEGKLVTGGTTLNLKYTEAGTPQDEADASFFREGASFTLKFDDLNVEGAELRVKVAPAAPIEGFTLWQWPSEGSYSGIFRVYSSDQLIGGGIVNHASVKENHRVVANIGDSNSPINYHGKLQGKFTDTGSGFGVVEGTYEQAGTLFAQDGAEYSFDGDQLYIFVPNLLITGLYIVMLLERE